MTDEKKKRAEEELRGNIEYTANNGQKARFFDFEHMSDKEYDKLAQNPLLGTKFGKEMIDKLERRIAGDHSDYMLYKEKLRKDDIYDKAEADWNKNNNLRHLISNLKSDSKDVFSTQEMETAIKQIRDGKEVQFPEKKASRFKRFFMSRKRQQDENLRLHHIQEVNKSLKQLFTNKELLSFSSSNSLQDILQNCENKCSECERTMHDNHGLDSYHRKLYEDQVNRCEQMQTNLNKLKYAYESAKEKLQQKAHEHLEEKGLATEGKFEGIETDKLATATIRNNEIKDRKVAVEKSRQEREENGGSGVVRADRNAENSINNMAQNDANRIAKRLQALSGRNVDTDKAAAGMVSKDKHIQRQGENYSKMVMQKLAAERE